MMRGDVEQVSRAGATDGCIQALIQGIPEMLYARRSWLSISSAALAAAVVAPTGALADATTTDLAVTCDAAAASAVRAAGTAFRARSGIRVRVFATAPSLVLPQLERAIQNDIIVTQLGTIDRAEKAGLVAPGGRVGIWRNRLMTAVANPQTGPEGSFVVPDATPASDFDGIEVLRRLGSAPASVVGVINSGAVAWSLANGDARTGVLHRTEIVADNRLQAVAAVPDEAWPPIVYAATVTTLARRGNPALFVAFLGGAEGQSVMRGAGLEVVP